MTGIVSGHLVVEPGGSAIVWGEVWRGVINRGGEADVFGSVGFMDADRERLFPHMPLGHIPSGLRF